jgi:hypothetical protein
LAPVFNALVINSLPKTDSRQWEFALPAPPTFSTGTESSDVPKIALYSPVASGPTNAGSGLPAPNNRPSRSQTVRPSPITCPISWRITAWNRPEATKAVRSAVSNCMNPRAGCDEPVRRCVGAARPKTVPTPSIGTADASMTMSSTKPISVVTLGTSPMMICSHRRAAWLNIACCSVLKLESVNRTSIW